MTEIFQIKFPFLQTCLSFLPITVTKNYCQWMKNINGSVCVYIIILNLKYLATYLFKNIIKNSYIFYQGSKYFLQHASSKHGADLREVLVTKALLLYDLSQLYAKVVSTLYFYCFD